MIVSSSSGSLKRFDNPNINNLLKTDGFKNVFRGLTYKPSVQKTQPHHHAGTYTSIGKRTPAREYHLTKDTESKIEC